MAWATPGLPFTAWGLGLGGRAEDLEEELLVEPRQLLVYFLRGEPEGELSLLEPYCVFGEQLARGPGCLYLAYPTGSGTSVRPYGPRSPLKT